ncbi:MAG: endo alpha-1,4 polygalactosaminidase [Campylobacterales bacterium]|nr:endo alpha-1,4 polygalactosaminidase [Campylobacterales bacterium]
MPLILALGTLLFTLWMAGCGGGGGSSSSPTPSSVSSVSSSLSSSIAPQSSSAASSWYRPSAATTYQIQLQGTPNTSYDADAYILDLFDTPQSVIDALHQRGKKVICYFSAGSYEEWRDDAGSFPKSVIGEPLDGWEGEAWLDVRSELLRPIMQARLETARQKGCDGVDPDNVDGHTQNSGFPISYNDQVAYNRFLSEEAHARGLAIGLKNDLSQIGDLVGYFDYSVNEQCFEYEECDLLSPFTAQNKPIFNIEYQKKYNNAATFAALCVQARSLEIRTLYLPLALDDDFRFSCDAL